MMKTEYYFICHVKTDNRWKQVFATERFVYNPCINDDHTFVAISNAGKENVLLFDKNEFVYEYVANLNEGLPKIYQIFPEKDLFAYPYVYFI